MAEQAADDLVKWFVEHGQAKEGEISAIGLGCDVANEESVQSCFKTVVDKYGRVDVLVNAAGIVGKSPLRPLHLTDRETESAPFVSFDRELPCFGIPR